MQEFIQRLRQIKQSEVEMVDAQAHESRTMSLEKERLKQARLTDLQKLNTLCEANLRPYIDILVEEYIGKQARSTVTPISGCIEQVSPKSVAQPSFRIWSGLRLTWGLWSDERVAYDDPPQASGGQRIELFYFQDVKDGPVCINITAGAGYKKKTSEQEIADTLLEALSRSEF